jgi:spermidine synthase
VLLKDMLGPRRSLQALSIGVMLALGAGWAMADRTLALGETTLYADDVILARNTPYQRIVLTAWKDDLRLFLNSHLQFSSRDEYRYHEALVHPGLAALPEARRVLVLGGGDGLALREILRYSHVEHITLVDLDPAMTQLFSTHPELVRLNHGAFSNPRVHVVNADAFVWLEQTAETFDFAVVDFRIRRISPLESFTRRRSTVSWPGTSAPKGAWSSKAHRRCLRASRSGASSRRWRRAG